MAAMASSVFRLVSVSSMRSTNFPSWCRANSQLNSAVRAPPMCRKPVGEGAKRTRTSEGIGAMEWWSNGVMHLFRQSATHYSSTSNTPLLQKDFSRAAADMSVSREIYFHDGGIPIRKPTHAFDDVESNFRDILQAQPFQNCAALDRDR